MKKKNTTLKNRRKCRLSFLFVALRPPLLVLVASFLFFSWLIQSFLVNKSSATSNQEEALWLSRPQQSLLQETTTQYSDWFANNGYAKAFDTMQYPMGIQYADTTYVVYQGPHEDPYIVSYDHVLKSWDGPYKMGVSALGHVPDPTTMHDGRTFSELVKVAQADNHGKPSIVLDDLGYFHVSFGAHGGDKAFKDELGKNKFGDYSAGKQTHLRSTNPLDITSWQVMSSTSGLDWNGCYAQMIKINHQIYHFVRHGAHVSCWTYQRSVDNGNTWEPTVPILLTEPHGKLKDSWYCRFRGVISRKLIQAVCVYHRHYGPPNHNLASEDGYYLYLDTETQTWYNVQGKPLQMPLSKERADTEVRALETEKRFPFRYIHPGSVGMDELGHAHLLFKIAVSGEIEGAKVGRGVKKLFHQQWTGTEWTEPVGVLEGNSYFQSGNQDGDMLVTNSTHLRVQFGDTNETHSMILSMESNDGGISWNPRVVYSIPKQQGKLLTSAFFENGGTQEANMAAYSVERTRTGAYRKLYLFGDNGPRQQKAKQANVCEPRIVSDNGSECVPVLKQPIATSA